MVSSRIVVSAMFIAAVSRLGAQAPAADSALVSRETAVWQATREKNPDAYGALLDPQYTAVGSNGRRTRELELGDVGKIDLKSFRLDSVMTRALDAHTQVVTYLVTTHATAGGRDISGRYWDSSLWRDVDGKWLLVLHSSSKTR
jgi:hypothetical protein